MQTERRERKREDKNRRVKRAKTERTYMLKTDERGRKKKRVEENDRPKGYAKTL